jgi:hypothetical protein
MFPLFPETDGIIEGLLSQCEYPYTNTKTAWREPNAKREFFSDNTTNSKMSDNHFA